MLIYTYISRTMYNQVMDNNRVYPELGVSCAAATERMYAEFQKRKWLPFFAWSKNREDSTESGIGDKPYVYLELEMPDDICIATNYQNWCDLISLYTQASEDPSNEEVEEILEAIGFNPPFRTLEQLWDDIYEIEQNDLNQVVYKYLDKSFIKRAVGVNSSKLTY